MSKRDAAWIVLKGLGIYSLINAVTYLPYVVYMACKLRGQDWATSEFFLSLGTLVLWTAAGFYLLKGGRALLRWIGTPEDEAQ